MNSFVVTRDRPVSELVAERLKEIPTAFGRLVYLARCVDRNGRYVHDGLRMTHDRASIDRALSGAHEHCFHEWLALTLEAQHRDFSAFLGGLNRRRALQSWSQPEAGPALCPRSADSAQRDLFVSDLRIIVEALPGSPGGDPSAER